MGYDLGDRFELQVLLVQLYNLKLPIIHVAGGHLTSGAIDDSIRHALTKLSKFILQAQMNIDKELYSWGGSDLTFVVAQLAWTI